MVAIDIWKFQERGKLLYTVSSICLHPAMDFTIVIPARLKSTRLPGKVLADLGGKPLLKHVWDAAMRVHGAKKVVVLTESQDVKEVVDSWGGICHLTPESCNSGTERISSALDLIDGDYIFNIQSDEPFLDINLIDRMIARARRDQKFDILTPIYEIDETQAILNPNVVKVVLYHDDFAIYFSRSPIPHVRGMDTSQRLHHTIYWGHMGVYLYRRKVLEDLASIPESPLATVESLEQLRFLQAGYRIGTIRAAGGSIAIDVPEDLAHARVIWNERKN
ncbi:MAG: 3-deoxy-manno-octulosonate cytidylyltransferase [Puniceicoccales bacterium]|jgi:3-deoxy-manno-octulosonate cytidylyltransferase (CMP-KDO synthetase)|nr:3-deoxy-manno-octulosonate cytidylyltransferase [Puniceicoccales bacterium]